MDFIEDFEANPSLDKIYSFTKQELLQVAGYFEIAFTKTAKKQIIKSKLLKGLSDTGILSRESSVDAGVMQNADKLLRLKELECRLDMREREMNHERALKERQMNFEYREMVLERELKLKELETKRDFATLGSHSVDGGFDLNKWVHLVPPFNERDVDCYFIMFERAANFLKWPRDVWPLLLQSVLTGKAKGCLCLFSKSGCVASI